MLVIVCSLPGTDFFMWAIPGLFFSLCLSFQYNWQSILWKNSPMTGFEPWTSGIGSNRPDNWATTTAQELIFVIESSERSNSGIDQSSGKQNNLFFSKQISFIFNCLFHNSPNKFDRQIIVSNQINQTQSWRKCKCCAGVLKRVSCHRGSNSWPRAWHSVPMFRAKCDSTQLSRCPTQNNLLNSINKWITTAKWE